MSFYLDSEPEQLNQQQPKPEKMLDMNKVQQFLDKHDYQLVEAIGKGGYATCFRVVNKTYKQTFVVKITRNDQSILEELKILSDLHHPYIVDCFGLFTEDDYNFLILEDCPYSNLYDEIQKNGPLEEFKLISYLHQLLEALNFLHCKGIAHLDIKPSNILVDKHGRVKLIDFGLSRRFGKEETCFCFKGTKLFKAPEYFLKKPFDPFKADIWALGLTIYYLATGSLIGKDVNQIYQYVASGCITSPYSKIPMIIKQICNMCLREKPENRKSLHELLIFYKENTLNANHRQQHINQNSQLLPNVMRAKSAMRLIVTPSIGRIGDKKKRTKSNTPSATPPRTSFLAPSLLSTGN